jgi:glutamate synthase (NADPH/NADH) small chain
MGNTTGFLDFRRETAERRPVRQRVRDWREIYHPLPVVQARQQGARCMDCGVPFCQQGCPLGNLIPDWNDLVYRDRWQQALNRLHATNNFPEFTGRLCPAPCEPSCVLSLNDEPVAIKTIEQAIVDRGWEEGWILPEPPERETGKRVAVVGSGPAGLAAAQQLRRAGHAVTVFERADRIGGLLVYGIPEFKMEKRHLDRRLRQMSAEGVQFRPGVNVGGDITAERLREEYDAVVLAGGATQPKEVPIPGRNLAGIYQAMHFLPMANRVSRCDFDERDGDMWVQSTPPFGALGEWEKYVTARGKRVLIVGGGDTGADCLGTVQRQGCRDVTQLQIHPAPPEVRAEENPWPQWSNVFRTSGAHEEGCRREFERHTLEFVGDEHGRVTGLRTIGVARERRGEGWAFSPVQGSEAFLQADLVLLATGFSGPESSPLLEQFGVGRDRRTNVMVDADRSTGVPGVFACGDMTRGQSLIVWAIAEGRQAAAGVDRWLMGSSDLPRPLDDGNDTQPFL